MPVTLKQPLSRGAALARLAQFLPLAGEDMRSIATMWAAPACRTCRQPFGAD
jgi:hypothetical protein